MSFNDLISSSKGPGVIGLILALIVLGGFLVLGTLTLDEPFQGGGQTLEGKVRAQERDIGNYRRKLESSHRRLSEIAALDRVNENLASRTAQIQILEKAAGESQALIAKTLEEISGIEKAVEAYKQQYRNAVRGAAKGGVLARIDTLDGQTFHDVTIRGVNAQGMQISHRDGSKRIPYDKLPLAMQDHYQFDPKEMKAAAAEEALVHQAHDRDSAAAQEAAKLQALQKQKEEEQSAAARRQQAITAINSRINALEDEIRNLRLDIDAETRKPLSRAPQMRLQMAKKEQEKIELESKLRALRAAP